MHARRSRIDAELRAALADPPLERERVVMDRTRSEQIVLPAQRLLERGGKRWRAQFMVMACEMYGDADLAFALTPLVELAHAGSLIVDDIEDGARTRHGGPAAHVEFGLDVAVNAGNLAYFLPTRLIDTSDLDDAGRLRAYRMHNAALRKLHYGQGLDIQWHQRHSPFPTIEEYFTMCALKSGSMAGLALGLGAAIGGAPEGSIDAYVGAGERFGVSFQIIDDVVNLETGTLGKERGDDLVEGKKSLPVIIHGPQRDGGSLRVLLESIRGRALAHVQPEVERAVDALEGSGSLAGARKWALDLYRRTRVDLVEVAPPGAARDELLTLADSLIGMQPAATQ